VQYRCLKIRFFGVFSGWRVSTLTGSFYCIHRTSFDAGAPGTIFKDLVRLDEEFFEVSPQKTKLQPRIAWRNYLGWYEHFKSRINMMDPIQSKFLVKFVF
jgi:hypothetical protein